LYVEKYHSELPTLLHFVAKYGLIKFANRLLELPGISYACSVRNVNGMTPFELAKVCNHVSIAAMMCDKQKEVRCTARHVLLLSSKIKSTIKLTEYK